MDLRVFLGHYSMPDRAVLAGDVAAEDSDGLHRQFDTGGVIHEVLGCTGAGIGVLLTWFTVLNVAMKVAFSVHPQFYWLAWYTNVFIIGVVILFADSAVFVVRCRAEGKRVFAIPVILRGLLGLPNALIAVLVMLATAFVLALPAYGAVLVSYEIEIPQIWIELYPQAELLDEALTVLLVTLVLMVTVMPTARYVWFVLPIALMERRHFAFRRSAELARGHERQILSVIATTAVVFLVLTSVSVVMRFFFGISHDPLVVGASIFGSVLGTLGALILLLAPLVSYQLVMEERAGSDPERMMRVFQ